jgi:hypothetical protein
LNRILVSIILVTTLFLLLCAPSLARADIKLIPPTNWQPHPGNNSTQMVWFENSTKSALVIAKPNLDIKSKSPFLFLVLPFMAPIIAQIFADQGMLESADQTSFGKSNYGYRYFLNISSPSKFRNTFENLSQKSGILGQIPKELEDVPFKVMAIVAQKHGDFYVIVFLSPRENFDSVLNEIKLTLDSIQLGNSTSTE